jgi:hypothetical protein
MLFCCVFSDISAMVMIRYDCRRRYLCFAATRLECRMTITSPLFVIRRSDPEFIESITDQFSPAARLLGQSHCTIDDSGAFSRVILQQNSSVEVCVVQQRQQLRCSADPN